MKNRQCKTCFFASLIAIIFLSASPGLAQTFISGSTGVDGAFSPAADITIPLPPDGVFNYTTVNIPTGETITYAQNSANTPVTILATGDVNIEGTLDIRCENGLSVVSGVLSNQVLWVARVASPADQVVLEEARPKQLPVQDKGQA
ncbi:MAG: hypothetical protein GXO96_06325 [Nitrospirae bacterium]|nr:hypothetical protein [Candidatus Manganitrophaceae bacterium]